VSDQVTLEFPAADRRALFSQIERAQREFGRSQKDAVKWAGGYLLRSLGASTAISPKLRPVVKNPLFKADSKSKADRAAARAARNDMRRARYGVMMFKREGGTRFVPIYRTGEYGKIYFASKKTAETLVRDRVTGEVTRVSMETGKGPEQTPGIMQSKKRIIGRRGLARESWKWAGRHLGNGGTGTLMQARNAIAVKWRGDKDSPSLTVTNSLRYIMAALKGKGAAVETAMQRAGDSMRHALDKKLVQKMGAK